jgi:hypothetical protein
VAYGGSGVNFIFVNAGSTASSIADVYFDDGTLLSISGITDSGAGVAFAAPATPGDLPGGNLANPDFVTSRNFSADSAAPVEANGVNAGLGEWLSINFSLQSGKTFADVLTALNLGQTLLSDPTDLGLRIGMHVQAIGTPGGSDSYINGPTLPGVNTNEEVPEPASIVLAAIGGLGAVAAGRRRRAQTA